MDPIAHKDILFIINPHAGGGKIKKIQGQLKSMAPEISCVITPNLTALDAVFKENMDRFRVFIIVGGDGSVNVALKYLYNRKDKLMGVFPTGSGNGFARELGFKKSLRSLIADTLKGDFTDINILSINGDLCINVAGLGYDSHIACQFQKSKGRGLINYVLLTLKSIFVFKPFNASLRIDRQRVEGVFFMITIANTRQFGNNAIVSPLSRADDGIYELVLVKPFPKYLYPVFVVRMFTGKLSDSRYIKFIKVMNQVEITSEFKQYHIDGEPKSFPDSLAIQMLPGKVRVLKTQFARE